MLRAFCVQEIGEHIPKITEPASYKELAKQKGLNSLSPAEMALALDNAVASDLLGLIGERLETHQSDLSPRQLAAARLLKSSSGSRLLTLNRQKIKGNENAGAQAKSAREAVREAATRLAEFLPRRDGAALLILVQDQPPELQGTKSKAADLATDAEFDQRVLGIARKRLEGIPGGYQDFERNYWRRGLSLFPLKTEFELIKMARWADVALGVYGGIDREIINHIDAWAGRQPNTRIEPFDVSRAGATPGDETQAAERETRTSPASGVATWTLRKPKRDQGYNMPLYRFLKTALDAGKPRPNSGEVLRAWKDVPPQGYGIEVADNLRSMTYAGGGMQPVRTANARAITRRIREYTNPERPD